MKYIYAIVIFFIFIGCTTTNELNKSIKLRELKNIPQTPNYYTKGISTNTLYEVQKEYKESYYKMWSIDKPTQTKKDIQWSFKSFNIKKNYGDNLLPLKQDFFDEMYEKSNFEAYLSVNKKALTNKYSSIRAMPTHRPILLNPSKAGEGFPFDYLQNSSINANVPIYISHYSKDKQWVFIFSTITYGWLRSDEVIVLSEEESSLWKNKNQIMITKESIPLFTKSNHGLFDTRIGMIFPLVEEDKNNYTILVAPSISTNKTKFTTSSIAKNIATKKTLVLNDINLNKIIKEVSKKSYGWGGLFEQRDCSSTLMDLYTPFGILLPRNSSKQSKVGKVINIKDLSNTEKIQVIKEQAVAFETLIYKKGHIMLYVGMYNDDVIIFQNTWGIKTKIDGKEGRFIIGKTIFSTLKIGEELENYDENSELLRNIESINIITQ